MREPTRALIGMMLTVAARTWFGYVIATRERRYRETRYAAASEAGRHAARRRSP